MPKLLKQYEVLHWASSFLEQYGREKNVAEILLRHHLQLSRSSFFMHMREEISEAVYHAFQRDIETHATTGIPIQHIIGTAPFYGREFHVSPAVLIPRFDTEILIHHLIKNVKKHLNQHHVTIVDVGTGSGIIAITLKCEIPELTVYATDISEEALKIAKKNAITHGADIHFLQGNFLAPFIAKQLSAHIIVSNPPYISFEEKDTLKDTVKDYDPPLALYAKEEGLAAYKEIISQSTELPQKDLKQIYFEIGNMQANAVAKLMKETYPSSHIATYQDLNRKDRVVAAQI